MAPVLLGAMPPEEYCRMHQAKYNNSGTGVFTDSYRCFATTRFRLLASASSPFRTSSSTILALAFNARFAFGNVSLDLSKGDL
jgi:hypothetical protein